MEKRVGEIVDLLVGQGGEPEPSLFVNASELLPSIMDPKLDGPREVLTEDSNNVHVPIEVKKKGVEVFQQQGKQIIRRRYLEGELEQKVIGLTEEQERIQSRVVKCEDKLYVIGGAKDYSNS